VGAAFRLGQPRWVELFSADVDAALAFYSALFGWTAEREGESDGYITLSKDGAHVAGLMAAEPDGAVQNAWSVDLHVDDALAVAESAAAHGATVNEVVDLGAEGTWVSLTDPTGAHVGAWQNGTHTGIQLDSGPGSAVWQELVTRDFDTAVAFYRDVFAWQTEVLVDTDDFRYVTLGRSPDSVSGILDGARGGSAGETSHWDVYFGVDDADAAIGRITELGGSALGPAVDTPYGRMAQAVDPDGAAFAIMQEPADS
jgi:predicted enzyme related to lactoylglutathione lyase